jgi:phage tail protein X
MAIVQISKIQQRSGNLVDLPQLDEAQFGWANDQRRLFIGATTPNPVENVEVLTSYSNINFSQINGSEGNLNVSNAQNGQIFAYVASTNTWENAGGNASQPGNSTLYSGTNIHLGNVANVKIGGGAIGYVLETDGLGNVSWTPKGTIIANISAVTKANPGVVTTANNNFFTDGTEITITDVSGMTQLNGNSYYVDVLTSNTFALYSDSGLTTPVNTTGYTTYSGNGRAIASVGGSGSAAAGGSNTTVQFNDNNVLTGNAGFTFNKTTGVLAVPVSINGGNVVTANFFTGTLTTAAQPNITSVGSLTSLTVTGNANVGNIGTAGLVVATGNVTGGNINSAGTVTASRLVSNVATGTAPLTVTSTTQVANLNVATAGLATFASTANAVAGANVSGAVSFATTANAVAGANVSGTVSSATSATTAGTVTTAAQPNITSTGTLTSLAVTGNISGANVTATHYGAATGLTSIPGANVTGTVPLATSATTAGTVTTAAQPNITSTGTLSALTVSANVATGGIKTDNYYYANGVSISFAGAYSNSNVASYLPTFTGTVGATALTTGANTTAGNITGNWVLTSGSRLNATYADLAEYYEADDVYEPGTVLEFGGNKEVTIAQDGTTRVAGVVSTNPAYAMNANCQGIAVAIALQGRVPTKVRGTIHKGDMMVSGGNGFARPSSAPQMGTVIGKALENFDGIEGVIEVAVGRL